MDTRIKQGGGQVRKIDREKRVEDQRSARRANGLCFKPRRKA